MILKTYSDSCTRYWSMHISKFHFIKSSRWSSNWKRHQSRYFSIFLNKTKARSFNWNEDSYRSYNWSGNA